MQRKEKDGRNVLRANESKRRKKWEGKIMANAKEKEERDKLLEEGKKRK